MRPIAAASVVLCLALYAEAARAGTLKVPSDDYPTIQSAVNAAAAGDVILVAPGEYQEAVVIDGRADLQIRGKGWPVVKPMGEGPGFSISGDSDGVLVSGFVVDGGTSGVDARYSADLAFVKLRILNCLSPGVYTEGCAGVLVSKCVITNLDSHGVEDLSSSGLVIEKCEIDPFPGDGDGIRLSEGAIGVNGSNGAVVEKNRITRAFGGIRVGGMDVVVSKNRIDQVGDQGVFLLEVPDSSGATVEKNRIASQLQAGIRSEAPGTVVSKNVLTACGIFSFGVDAVVDRNRLAPDDAVGYLEYGILINGDDSAATGNRVSEVEIVGMQVLGDRPLIQGNAVAGSNEHGITISGVDGTIAGNRVSGAAGYGFDVIGTGHTLTGNRASGSGLFDLHESNAEGVNTYSGNRFGTSNVAFPF
jgi:hypothetical protein